MAINLLTTTQEKLNFEPLKKIDPNSQDNEELIKGNAQALQQASLVTALAGIYNLSRSEEGLITISGESSSTNWLSILFGDNSNEVAKNIASYCGTDEEAAKAMTNKSAEEAIKIIRENISTITVKELRNFISSQRDFILPYIPAALKLGKLLDDNTMDDQTNKMEGPLSSLLHKIEKGFSGSDTAKEAERKAKNF
ncbi:MAG: hypothetical protein ABIP30_03715 [Ferruginibacter sp.]